MDNLTKQFSWLSVAGFALGFYATWVLQCLWNWFLVPATGFPRISFWLMYGLYLLAHLLVHHHRNELAAQMRSEVLGASIEACVPEERQEALQERLDGYTHSVWLRQGWSVFEHLSAYTTTLVLGWIVHLLASL